MAWRKRGVRDGDFSRVDYYNRRVRRAVRRRSTGCSGDTNGPPSGGDRPPFDAGDEGVDPVSPGRIAALTLAAPGSRIESVTGSRDSGIGGPCRDNGGGGGTVAGVGGSGIGGAYFGAGGNSHSGNRGY